LGVAVGHSRDRACAVAFLVHLADDCIGTVRHGESFRFSGGWVQELGAVERSRHRTPAHDLGLVDRDAVVSDAFKQGLVPTAPNDVGEETARPAPTWWWLSATRDS
jgi:hypothetical protein